MSDLRTPPNDIHAEQAAISLALGQGWIPEPLDTLAPGDFYQPVHAYLWQVMRWLLARGQRCDGTAVHARLMDLHTDRQAVFALSALPDLITTMWASNPETLTTILIDRSGKRRLIEVAERAMLDATHGADDYEEILFRIEREFGRIERRDFGNLDSLVELSNLANERYPEPDWVIPNLMAKGERVIITGTEGLGKSTLCRQLGICAAAGLAPFHNTVIEPRTVLLIDAENSEYILKKRFMELWSAVINRGRKVEDGRFWIDRRPDGLNLAEAADRRWLQRRIRKVRPDLLVIGPAYKLHEATNEDKDEVIARTVTGVLDDLRGDAGLVLEHHAGNGQVGQQRPVRPFGSSLWRRWPEFGVGIRQAKPTAFTTEAQIKTRRAVDLVEWRGARDVRSWPSQLDSGGSGMPWMETVVE